MAGHDFFVAGRWRNRDSVREVVATLRSNGYSTYSFIDHAYPGQDSQLNATDDFEQFVRMTEDLPQDDSLIRQIFETDIAAQRAAESFLLVLPAGAAGHIEAGLSAGWGKPCFAIGPAKTETLYCVFDRIFPDLEALTTWLRTGRSKRD